MSFFSRLTIAGKAVVVTAGLGVVGAASYGVATSDLFVDKAYTKQDVMDFIKDNKGSNKYIISSISNRPIEIDLASIQITDSFYPAGRTGAIEGRGYESNAMGYSGTFKASYKEGFKSETYFSDLDGKNISDMNGFVEKEGTFLYCLLDSNVLTKDRKTDISRLVIVSPSDILNHPKINDIYPEKNDLCPPDGEFRDVFIGEKWKNHILNDSAFINAKLGESYTFKQPSLKHVVVRNGKNAKGRADFSTFGRKIVLGMTNDGKKYVTGRNSQYHTTVSGTVFVTDRLENFADKPISRNKKFSKINDFVISSNIKPITDPKDVYGRKIGEREFIHTSYSLPSKYDGQHVCFVSYQTQRGMDGIYTRLEIQDKNTFDVNCFNYNKSTQKTEHYTVEDINFLLENTNFTSDGKAEPTKELVEQRKKAEAELAKAKAEAEKKLKAQKLIFDNNYVGTYQCGRSSKFELNLESIALGQIKGLFEFDIQGKKGSYYLEGYATGNNANLWPTEWVNQPRDVNPTGFTIDINNGELSGKINSPNCSSINGISEKLLAEKQRIEAEKKAKAEAELQAAKKKAAEKKVAKKVVSQSTTKNQSPSKVAKVFAKNWKGIYQCGRNARFDLMPTAIGGNDIVAEIKYKARDGSVGHYKLRGSINPSNLNFNLTPDSWIKRPAGNGMIGFKGAMDPDGTEIAGVVSASSCDGFLASNGNTLLGKKLEPLVAAKSVTTSVETSAEPKSNKIQLDTKKVEEAAGKVVKGILSIFGQ